MSEISIPGRDSVDAQRELFRRAEAEHSLSIRVLKVKARIALSTLKGWRDGAAMPAWALGALGEAGVPDDLLSLVLAPFDRFVGTAEPGEGDFDTAATDASDLTGTVARARHPNSPGGIAIVPQEAAVIKIVAGRSACSARKAAA